MNLLVMDQKGAIAYVVNAIQFVSIQKFDSPQLKHDVKKLSNTNTDANRMKYKGCRKWGVEKMFEVFPEMWKKKS
uniref:Uncharacterized protein n=1 Tax=Romanomermis culicivorax TaxID=13658 RepID=A0A915K6T2_ROMCU